MRCRLDIFAAFPHAVLAVTELLSTFPRAIIVRHLRCEALLSSSHDDRPEDVQLSHIVSQNHTTYQTKDAESSAAIQNCLSATFTPLIVQRRLSYPTPHFVQSPVITRHRAMIEPVNHRLPIGIDLLIVRNDLSLAVRHTNASKVVHERAYKSISRSAAPSSAVTSQVINSAALPPSNDMGTTKYLARSIPTISLASFDSRVDTITSELVSAAEKDGFFCIVDHGISREQIDQMFDNSAAFFNLEDSTKATVPFSAVHNAGWEKNAQIRPSTGAADQKESYQMQFSENMEGRWIAEDMLPEFKDKSLAFMHSVQAVSEKLMVCFARGLGFEDDFFIKCHDVSKNDSQTVARLLHYFATPENTNGEVFHRAGAHTDWDFLTLLFQKAGQSGLEICPGREVSTSFGYGDTWTKVDPDTESNAIICNIGDLLMSWSDDRFKSTFHRVKAPSEPGDYYGERYSIAFFNQPRKSAEIQGPKKKYPMVTGGEFTRNAMQRNFKALLEKTKANLKSEITASVIAVKEVPATA